MNGIRNLLCLVLSIFCTSLYSMVRTIDMVCPRPQSSNRALKTAETREELLIALCMTNDFEVSMEEDPLELVRTILAQGLDVNATDDYDNTALHYATVHGNKPLVELLLKSGARVNRANWNCSTPLNIAIRIGSIDLVKLFLDWGARIDSPMKETKLTPLMVAALYRKKGCCELLVSRGASLDMVNAQVDALPRNEFRGFFLAHQAF